MVRGAVLRSPQSQVASCRVQYDIYRNHRTILSTTNPCHFHPEPMASIHAARRRAAAPQAATGAALAIAPEPAPASESAPDQGSSGSPKPPALDPAARLPRARPAGPRVRADPAPASRHVPARAAGQPCGSLGVFAVTVPTGTIQVDPETFTDCAGLAQVTPCRSRSP